VVRTAARANAFTDIFLTKLDILTGWERIPVCVGYEVDGTHHDSMPLTQSEFARAVPVYEELDGWSEDISGCRSFDDLPKNTQAYVNRLEELCGAPISGIGVGPDREQSIVIRDLL
jgi:adenylosuccinate synthase